MRFSTLFCAAVFSSVALAQGNNNNQGGNNNNNQGGNNNNNNNNGGGGGGGTPTLDANAVQTGSANDGGDGGVAADGQALSATSDENFINFCSGKTLTNGLQTEGGSCNGIVMGEIPAKGNMISAIITNPQTGQDVAADTTFDISVQVDNLAAGSFTNAQETYYAAPQALEGGKIVGHTHVTVQDMGGNMNPNQPLDPTQFAFFKGINDAGNGNGLLSATVTGGLPAGNYRVCSMTSASNHQPVLMPVAQRGAQDDCTKFTVGAGNGGNNGGNNNNNAGNNNADNNAGNNNADNNAGNNNADNNAGNNNADNNAGNNNADNNAGNNNADNNAGNNNADNNAGNNDQNQNNGGNNGGNADGAAASTTAADAAATTAADAAATTAADAAATTAADAAATSAAADPNAGNQGNNGANNGGGGRGGRGRGRGRKQRARRFIQ